MKNGAIYLIVNWNHVKQSKPPYFYIGSKADITKLSEYWSSSEYLTKDIKEQGIQNFEKFVLAEISTDLLLILESKIQRALNCVEDERFYNRSFAIPEFHTMGGQHSKGLAWINNGKKNRRVPKHQLREWANQGYAVGRMVTTFNTGRIYMHNGVKTKAVTDNEVAQYLENGWQLGKLKGNQKGKTWMTKDGQNKLAHAETLAYYLSQGWKKGFTLSKRIA